MSMVPGNVDSFLHNCPVFLSNFFDWSSTAFELSISLLLCVKVDFGCSWLVVQNWRIPLGNGNLLLSFKELNSKSNISLTIELIESSDLFIYSNSRVFCLFISPLVPLRVWSVIVLRRKFLHYLIPPHYACCCPRHNSRWRSLSLCGCTLPLTLTTFIGIRHSAGAAKSGSSVLSLSCSCRISLCIRSNYDSSGWVTRIIHFSSLVFSTVSISLAIRNHSFRLQIEGRLTFRVMSSVAIRRKRVNLLQPTGYKVHSPAKSKNARCSGKIAEVSSKQ